MKTVCGIDLGTQSCKVILYNPEAKQIVAKTQSPLQIIAKNDGTREQHASWYEEALLSVLQRFLLSCVTRLSRLGSLGNSMVCASR